MSIIKWIEEWYDMNCNGDWEHCYGIKIENIDNPGWSVKIDLRETEWEEKYFEKLQVERTEDDWIYCNLKEGRFDGAGGPRNLEEILIVFKEWIEGEV